MKKVWPTENPAQKFCQSRNSSQKVCAKGLFNDLSLGKCKLFYLNQGKWHFWPWSLCKQNVDQISSISTFELLYEQYQIKETVDPWQVGKFKICYRWQFQHHNPDSQPDLTIKFCLSSSFSFIFLQTCICNECDYGKLLIATIWRKTAIPHEEFLQCLNSNISCLLTIIPPWANFYSQWKVQGISGQFGSTGNTTNII